LLITPTITLVLIALVSIAIVYIAADQVTKYCKNRERPIMADSTTDFVVPLCCLAHIVACAFLAFWTSYGLVFIIIVMVVSVLAIAIVAQLKQQDKAKAASKARTEQERHQKQWDLDHCKHLNVKNCVCLSCGSRVHRPRIYLGKSGSYREWKCQTCGTTGRDKEDDDNFLPLR